MAGANAPQRDRGRIERRLLSQGLLFAGVDEVGRGCLAGPLHAGCVVLDWSRLRKLPSSTRSLIRDSKQLSATQRERILPVIEDISLGRHVASASVEEINELGIVAACFLAMRRAIAGCGAFDVLLVDGKLRISGYDGRQETIVKGDYYCFSIAAASILAKTTRDQFMRQQALVFPNYGFDAHVGYGTKAHFASISKLGICELHRKTFAPIRNHIEAAKSPTLRSR